MSQPELQYAEREVVLRANFEDIDADGLIDVSARFMRGPRPPHPGETIFLKDPSGEGRLGRVVAVHGWIVRVALVDDEPVAH